MIIPEFQRRRLASSVVGTPGIDTSGAQAAGAVAQSAGQVANTFQTLAVQRQDAMDKAVAFDKSLDYDSEVVKLSAENRKEYSVFDGDPSIPAEALRQKTASLRDSMARSMSSDKARAQFLQDSGSTMTAAFKSELTAASKNQVAIGLDKVQSANTKISNSAYTLFKDHPDIPLDSKMAILRHLESKRAENIINSRALLGMEEANKQDKASMEGLAVAAVGGAILDDPDSALKLLKEKSIKAALGADKHADWSEKAKKRAMDFKEIVKEREYEYLAENHSVDLKAVEEGAGLDYILNIQDQKASKILLDKYVDAKQLTALEVAEREAMLTAKFEDFFVRNKKTDKLTNVLKKDKTMKDVVELQYDYMRNVEILRGQGSLKASLPEYPNMLRQAIKRDKPQPVLDAFIDMINATSLGLADAVTGSAISNDRAKDKAYMNDKLYSKLLKINPDNVVEIQQASRDALLEYQFHKTPEVAKYVVGETYDFGGIPMKAVRKPDGSVGFDNGK